MFKKIILIGRLNREHSDVHTEFFHRLLIRDQSRLLFLDYYYKLICYLLR